MGGRGQEGLSEWHPVTSPVNIWGKTVPWSKNNEGPAQKTWQAWDVQGTGTSQSKQKESGRSWDETDGQRQPKWGFGARGKKFRFFFLSAYLEILHLKGVEQGRGACHDLIIYSKRFLHLLYGKQTISQKEWKQRYQWRCRDTRVMLTLEENDGGSKQSDRGSTNIWIMISISQDLRKQTEFYFKNCYTDYLNTGPYSPSITLLLWNNFYPSAGFPKLPDDRNHWGLIKCPVWPLPWSFWL